MRLAASLFAFASATCPNAAWSTDANNDCVPAADSDFSTSCGTDGTLTVTFKLDHLYSTVATSFQAQAVAAVTAADGTYAATEDAQNAGVYEFTTSALTFTQATADKIVGTFILAVSQPFQTCI